MREFGLIDQRRTICPLDVIEFDVTLPAIKTIQTKQPDGTVVETQARGADGILVVTYDDPVDGANGEVGSSNSINRYHYDYGSDSLTIESSEIDNSETGAPVGDAAAAAPAPAAVDGLTNNSEVGQLVNDNDPNAEVSAIPEGTLSKSKSHTKSKSSTHSETNVQELLRKYM